MTMRSLPFYANFARIIKVYSLINKRTFERRIGINAIYKRSMILRDFPPSNMVKLNNVGRLYQILDHSFPTCP